MKLDIETKKIEASIDQTGIGWLIFNNPARHNALSLEMWKGIGDAFEQFNDANDVRAVIMRGAGVKRSYQEPIYQSLIKREPTRYNGRPMEKSLGGPPTG